MLQEALQSVFGLSANPQSEMSVPAESATPVPGFLNHAGPIYRQAARRLESPVRPSRPLLKACLSALGPLLSLILSSAATGQGVYSYDPTGNLALRSSSSGGPPQILAQPRPQIVTPGELASFSVVLADATEATFQWRFNDSPMQGATGDTLLLSNVGFTNEGQYTVVITNSFGSVTSAPAPLMIDSLGGGMPDAWQAAYFGSIGQNSAGDFDGDGVSNLDEFLEGTDPIDPRSFNPRLRIQAALHGQVLATPGLPYYTMGQHVILTAVPDPYCTFLGWSGDVHGLKTQISVLMDGHKSVTASFSEPMQPPVFVSVRLTNTTVSLTWVSVPGSSYQVQYTTDLQEGAWVNLGGTNVANDVTLTVYETVGLDPQRFYRVAVLP